MDGRKRNQIWSALSTPCLPLDNSVHLLCHTIMLLYPLSTKCMYFQAQESGRIPARLPADLAAYSHYTY